MAGGVAVINVGAATEVEMNEKKERVKDAVEATKAAIEEGVVPGGGVALLRARKILIKDNNKLAEQKGKGELTWRDFKTAGDGILYNVLSAPLSGIVGNAQANSDWVLRKVEENKNPNFGFNVKTMKFGDMLEEGVLDPAKVVRLALQNAASVATMVLTTEVLVTDLPEKEEKMAMPAGMGGMGGMGGMPEM